MINTIEHPKAPFIKIWIGTSERNYTTKSKDNPNEQNFVELPDFLLKQVAKIELNEIVDIAKNSGSRLEITVTEKTYSTPDEIDTLIDRGIITSKAGTWLDLKFANTQQGPRIFTRDKIEKSKQTQKRDDEIKIKDEVDRQNPDNSEPSKQTIAESRLVIDTVTSTPRFLLETGNIVQLEFGYGESAFERRVVRYRILMIDHVATNSGIPITKISCLDEGVGRLQKVRPRGGLALTKGNVTKVTEIEEVKDASGIVRRDIRLITKKLSRRERALPANDLEILNFIAAINNYEIVFDDEAASLLLAEKPSQSKIWSQNYTAHQFIVDIAEDLGLFYFVEWDFNRQKYTINILSRKESKKTPYLTFIWKNGAAIDIDDDDLVLRNMKTFRLFETGLGGQSSGTTGVNIRSKKREDSWNVVLADKDNDIDTTGDPVFQFVVAKKDDPELRKKYRDKGIDTAGYMSYGDSLSSNVANAAVAERYKSTVRLEFEHVGLPIISPGYIRVLNIGDRFSGNYWLRSVSHIISPTSGYICKCTAESMGLPGGGVQSFTLNKKKQKAKYFVHLIEDEKKDPVFLRVTKGRQAPKLRSQPDKKRSTQ